MSASRRRIRTQAEWNVDTHIFSATGPDERADPVLHLVRRLVGERDGEDLEGADALVADEVGDAVREHAGLARTGAGHDEQGPVDVGDGLRLDRVQPLEERVVGRGSWATQPTGRLGQYGPSVTAPRDVVVVLLDSLNRHLLGCYGGTEFDTPNLDRLAARSVRFTNHHTGSLPCMPARHDLLVGALDFPWRPWGSIEVWEDAITALLRRDAGMSTMLVSDHPHLFETGGENYHTDFGAWDYLRGHEDDPWRTRPDPSWIGAPALPAQRPPWERGYDISRTWFKERGGLPGSADDVGRSRAGSTASCPPDALPRSERCSSSTSSTRTSPSTSPSRGPVGTTRTGRASASSGRRTPRARSSRGSPTARACTCAASTAPSSR